MKAIEDAFFLNQIKLQKQRLLAFIPATLFMILMFWGRIQKMAHKPWYILVLGVLYLIYGLVWLPLRNAIITSKTIRRYTIHDNGLVDIDSSIFSFSSQSRGLCA